MDTPAVHNLVLGSHVVGLVQSVVVSQLEVVHPLDAFKAHSRCIGCLEDRGRRGPTEGASSNADMVRSIGIDLVAASP